MIIRNLLPLIIFRTHFTFLGVALGGLGSLIGGALSNSSNAKENVKSREFARQERAIANKRHDSAYQRSVADMRKAGLNPMLAAMNQSQAGTASPASSPGGGFHKNVVSEAVNSAVSSYKASQEAKLIRDQRNKLSAEAGYAMSKDVESKASRELIDTQLEILRGSKKEAIGSAKQRYKLEEESASIDRVLLKANKGLDIGKKGLGAIGSAIGGAAAGALGISGAKSLKGFFKSLLNNVKKSGRRRSPRAQRFLDRHDEMRKK